MLENAVKLAPILLPSLPQAAAEELIGALGTFWILIQCGYVLFVDQFGDYCDHLDRLLRQYIDWHPGVPAMHLDISWESSMK